VRWGLAQLQIGFSEAHGVACVQLSEEDRTAFDGQAEIRLPLDSSGSQEARESLDWDGRFGLWLRERLRAGEPTLHVRPREQPVAVRDLSDRLLSAYRVDGGQVHLAGCQLTDYSFLRLSFAAADNGRPNLRHVFVAHDGSSVSNHLVENLCLDQLDRIENQRPRIDAATLTTLIAAGHHAAAKTSTLRNPAATVVEPVLLSVIWVKHASGQLQFTIGDSSCVLPFSGWAKLIQAQPFVAEQSGASTFHLAATDDGRIDAYHEIATCDRSGRRVLREDLVICSVTGKNVLAEFTRICPVSGRPALDTEFTSCSVCRQPVSKAVLDAAGCGACRGLVRVKKDDPRIVWICGEHPGLDRWSTWRLAETQHVYIAQASSWLKRLLVVVDKETLAVRHLATAGRLAAGWTHVAEAAQAELLV